jgi:hypothetical protein
MSKILIIEDEAADPKSTYQNTLRRRYYQVEDAEDGVVGYEK